MLILALACEGHFAFGSSENLRVSAQDNLRYQLDCLARLVRCTVAPSALRSEIESNPTAARKLDEWRAARNRLATLAQSTARSTSPLPPIADLASHSGRQTNGARTLAGRTTSFDDPVQHQLIAYFSPLFAKDWQDTDRTSLGRMKVQMQSIFERGDMRDLLARIRQFLIAPADAPPTATLIAIPGASAGSLATLDDNLIYVEVPRGDSAENRLPVLAHEYIHFWLAHQTSEQSRQLSDAFARSTHRCNVVAFGLFEEALASALGNGVVEQQLSTPAAFDAYLAVPDSFYADTNIDILAKAILPTVNAYVARGRRIDNEFVDTFIAQTEAALGDGCESISLGMRTSAMVLSSDSFLEVGALARARWRTSTVLTDVRTGVSDTHPMTALQHYELLSGIVMTTSQALNDMTVLPAALRQALITIQNEYGRFVYSWPRARGADIYIVVGADNDATIGTMVQLIALRERRFTGLWVPPALPQSSTD